MATASNDFFAFELLNKFVDKQLCKKEDVIILFTHWFLVKNGFKCIGLGDSKTIEGTEEGSEFLPDGWNSQDFYSMRYIKDNELNILLGRRSDDNLLLNLLRVKDNCVSNIKFPIESTVNIIHGPLSSQIPNHQNVMQEINKHLVVPISPGNGREISTQTMSEQSNTDGNIPNLPPYRDDNPLRVGPPRAPQGPRGFLEEDPREIGRGDLDPFWRMGSRGGGMIYDPFPHRGRLPDPERPGLGGPARLPPGAVPPGARFDPFGPQDIGRPRIDPRNPDHDHFPPPGYGDDMFM